MYTLHTSSTRRRSGIWTRKWRLIAVMASLTLALALLAGCTGTAKTEGAGAETAAAKPSQAFPVTITDDASRSVTIDSKPERIVSLAPANTEIVFALGGLDRVVGVTTYDDYPAEVADIAKMGDFVKPNLEAIAAAKPDVVLLTGGVQGDVVTKLESLGAKVVVVDPQSLDALYVSIEVVGRVLGDSKKAEAVIDDMKGELADIRAKASSEPAASTFVEIAQNPLFTAGPGTLIDDLVVAAGGTNVVKQQGYVAYSIEQLAKDDPQVYLATKGSMSDPATLGKRAGYDKLTAVKNGRVAVLEDNLVSRPGPRVVEGVRQIARALHPDAFK